MTGADAPAPPPARRWTLQTRLLVTVLGLVSALLVVVAFATSTVLGRILDAQLTDNVKSIQQRSAGSFSNAILPGGAKNATEVLDSITGQADFLLVMRLQSIHGTTVVAQDSGAYVTPLHSQAETLSQTAVDDVQTAAKHLRIDPETNAYTTTDIFVSGVGGYRITIVGIANGRVIVGLPLSQIDRPLSQLILAIIFITVGGLFILAVATIMVIRSGLRPLRQVVSTAERIADLKLDEGEVSISDRVASDAVDDHSEIGRVGTAINTMLDHVDSSFQARARNEERMRRFVADASHELRTPLASIRGYSELSLRATDNPGATTSSLERIHAQSLRMTRLVEDLLLLARLEEGREIAMSEVDLTPLVIDAVGDQRVAGPEHIWELAVTGAPVLVEGDSGRLQQVVGNLLANARTHTPEGTVISVSLSAEPGEAVIRVADDGPGIEPEIRDELFSRFTRGDKSRARKSGGTGLGLSIVKAIVEAHQGTITVTSEPGATEFVVRIPLHIVGSAVPPPPGAGAPS